MPLNLASRERLQPSLLDRLTDLNPESPRDPADQQSLSMTALRQAVLRDLAWLLNTTNLATTDDLASAPKVATSTLNYGIPGFAGLFALSGRTQALESSHRHRHQNIRAPHLTRKPPRPRPRRTRGGRANRPGIRNRRRIVGAAGAATIVFGNRH